MKSIAECTLEDLQALRTTLQGVMAASDHVEDAAQAAVRTIHEAVGSSVPLVRLYLTIPFGLLGDTESRFAAGLAAGDPRTALDETTPVLTLLGTAGEEPAWNDRRRSRGHVAIPLVSPAFVAGIPMIASLLQQLGLDTRLPVQEGIARLCEKSTSFSGLFYVRDAASTVDERGRKVIPAQDFVARHRIRSVIGSAATHIATRSLLALVLFTRDPLERSHARLWTPLAGYFAAWITAKLTANRIFRGGTA